MVRAAGFLIALNTPIAQGFKMSKDVAHAWIVGHIFFKKWALKPEGYGLTGENRLTTIK